MRNSLLFIFALVFLCPPAIAQRFLTEVFPSVTKTANVTYGSNYSVLSGSPVLSNLKMDVYEPGGITDTMVHRPLIIFLHSGSFLPPYLNTQLEGGRNDSGIILICESFAKRGYVVANIDYRLGWNAAGSDVDIRRGTLITAFVRAIQDVKAAVRYFRKDAGTTNTYKIDSNRVIVGGEHTGGALAVNFAALQTQAQLSIPKFISSTTNATYGFQAGLPYVNPALIGDLDGYGGNAALNNPNNSPGYNGKANFIFSYEGIIGDSSWVVPRLPPIVAFHRLTNSFNQPYYNGIVYVIIGGIPQAVVDVSGSGVYIPLTNAKGNNACFRPNTFTDPYTVKAMALSGGIEGLYPQLDSNSGISWFDSLSVITECQAYGVSLANCNAMYTSNKPINSKPKSLLHLDTLMGYLNPRIVKCLYPTASSIEAAQALQKDIYIFPNPSTGNITITATGAGNGINSVVIKDITGKVIQHVTAHKEQKLDLRLQNIPAGMYVITVATERTISSQKLRIE